jgi:hypothetical protein
MISKYFFFLKKKNNQKLENPVIHPDLKLCTPNKFIPTNFTVNKLENITVSKSSYLSIYFLSNSD